MDKIEFDDATADRLVKAANSAADVLRSQGSARRSAAEDAAEDFDGAYANRFIESAQVESEDRSKLSSVLSGLGEQVTKVKAEAAKERKRLSEVAAWEARQEERRRAVAASPVGGIDLPPQKPLDIRPPQPEVQPTPIDATFAARGRTRTGQGTGSGRSSADPAKLRSFSSVSRANDTAASSQLTALKNAWSAFTAACGWAEVNSFSFLSGFDRWLQENGADAAWVERIAAAFERAGGHGSLSNVSLDAADAAGVPKDLEKLFAKGLTATEVAALWGKLGYSKADARDLAALPIEALSQLGNLEGVPYWARSTVNIAALDQRIADAKDFLNNLNQPAYQNQAERAKNARGLLGLQNIKIALKQGARAGTRFLISLSEDAPPLAAISIGDLDSASNVTWAVPGMGSSSRDMVGWTDASQNVYDMQGAVDGPPDRAVISWVGYDAPAIPGTAPDVGVLFSDRAADGGQKLADSIRGLSATRSSDMPMTNIVGHSYGTTAGAYGLTAHGVHVNTFTAVASAGIPDSIPDADALHADHVYAGQARNVIPLIESGDGWAATGREHSWDHHQDPTADYFGATTFGADGSGTLEGVTNHAVHTSSGTGYLDMNTEALKNVALATTGQGDKMTAYHPKGQTPLEEALGLVLGSGL